MQMGDQNYSPTMSNNNIRELDHEVVQRGVCIFPQNLDEFLEEMISRPRRVAEQRTPHTESNDAPAGPSQALCSSVQADIQTFV